MPFSDAHQSTIISHSSDAFLIFSSEQYWDILLHN